MKLEYKTRGTCASAIILDVDDSTEIINGVQFVGGCNGNTIGISALVRGQKASDVIKRLEGIRCGLKSTSCPDQLASALRLALAK